MRETTARHYREVAALTATEAEEPAPESIPARVRVIVLASGSEGNSLLVNYGTHTVMVDAGLEPETARRRARSVGFILDKLDALLVTHWHSDHAGHAVKTCVEYRCPMVSSRATYLGLPTQPPHHRKAVPGEMLDGLGTDSLWHVWPIKVQHEEGSLAYHLRVGEKNIVIAHDLQAIESSLLGAARAADALLIEANHDPELLAAAPPEKADHVAHSRCHLANETAAEIVRHVDPSRIQVICLLHLSSSFNTAATAERVVRAAIPEGARPHLLVASQSTALLLEVNGGPAPLEISVADRARILDRQVDALVDEQRRSNEETQKRWVQLGRYMVEMQNLFEAQEPDEPLLLGYASFTEWMRDKAKQLGRTPRHIWYCIDAEKHVVPLIGREATEALSMGSSDALAKYAKDKHTLPEDLVEFAKDHPAHEVKDEVFKRLYPGNSGHFDGPEAKLVLTAGKDRIASIQKLVADLRAYTGTEHLDGKGFEDVGDAEVVEFALITLQQERDRAAREALREAVTRLEEGRDGQEAGKETYAGTPEGNGEAAESGVPEPPDIDELLASLN